MLRLVPITVWATWIFYAQGVVAPIKKLHIDYARPLRFEDWFTIEGLWHWSEAARLSFEFILRNEQQQVVIHAVTACKCCWIPTIISWWYRRRFIRTFYVAGKREPCEKRCHHSRQCRHRTGTSLDATWTALLAGHTAIAEVERFDTDHYLAEVAACVPDLTADAGGSRLYPLLDQVLNQLPRLPEDARLFTATTKGAIDLLEQGGEMVVKQRNCRPACR